MHCYTQWGGRNRSDVSVFMDALQVKPEFKSQKQDEDCLRIITNLTDEEVEMAANTSYAFWFVTSQMGLCLDESVKINMAQKEVKRHLVAHEWVYETALQSIRDAIELRKQYNVEKLRLCFGPDNSFDTTTSIIRSSSTTEEVAEEICQLQSSIELYLHDQPFVVQQHYKESRAILFPRRNKKTIREEEKKTNNNDNSDDEDEDEALLLLMAQFYMVERGLAVREFASSGEDEAIVPILDFHGLMESAIAQQQSSKYHYCAMLSSLGRILQKNSQLLQKIYPGRFRTVTCVNSPSYVSSLYDMVSSSGIIQRRLQRNNIDRMTFVNSNDVVDNDYSSDPTFFFDVHHYLWNVPFHVVPYESTKEEMQDYYEGNKYHSDDNNKNLHHCIWSQALVYLMVGEYVMHFVEQAMPLYTSLLEHMSKIFSHLAPITTASSTPNESQPIISSPKPTLNRQSSSCGPPLCKLKPVGRRASSCQAGGAWMQSLSLDHYGFQIDAARV